MLNLNWVKCNGSVWCNLLRLDLTSDHLDNLEGVYIIWHAGQYPRTVRVGQGEIARRLTAHRQDPEILAYRAHGLYVTWASVSSRYRDGVERFLAEKLNPLVGTAFPDVDPIPVNLPW